MRFGKTSPFLEGDKSGNNILLTGVPRSGTTLACRLLCEFSQTIALNEPIEAGNFVDPQSALENIGNHFKNFRNSLLNDGTAQARTKDGVITDNAYSNNITQREKVVKRTEVVFNKPLKSNFTLMMKHCSEFTLLLPGLADFYSIYAIIRNPLALLASWNSVNVPVSRGRVAKSEKLNPEFHTALGNTGEDLLKRQLFILSWYFGQYEKLNASNVIRYEEMVADPLKLLQPLAYGEALSPFENLISKNASENYDKTHIEKAAEALLKTEGKYWKYYSKEEVKNLLHKVLINE